MGHKQKLGTIFNSLKTITLTIGFVILCVVAIIALSSRFNLPGGYRAYSVLTGSMEPVIQTGSLIFTKSPTSTGEIKKNEVITFEEPGFENKFITHRVSQIVNSNPGVVFKAKGDANKGEDPWIISYGRIKGVYLAHLPYAGSLLEFIKSPTGIIIFIVIPVLLIAFDESKNIISTLADIKIDKERKKAEKDKVNLHSFLWILAIPLIGLGVGQTRALFFSNHAFLSSNTISVAAISPSPSALPSPSTSPSVGPSSNPSSTPIPSISPSPSASPIPSSTPVSSPSPSPSGSGTTVIIIGNDSGSNNTVNVNNNSNCTSNQNSNTNVDLDISSGVNSGSNNGNSNTGNSSSSVSVNVIGGTNSSSGCP